MQTILLIDSCALTRECLSAILRAKGYRLQSAGLVSQAKSMIARRPPDIIITEIRLPDDNALNLMRSLRDNPSSSRIKVCLLTNAAAKKPIMEAIELGAAKVMLKSKFTIGSLLEQLDAIVSPTNEPAPGSSGVKPPRYSLPMPATPPGALLKEIKPIIARSELNARLEAVSELCALEGPSLRIVEAIDTPETSIERVAELLRLDQAIAMKVMKIANSSTYARSEQTTTLKDAVLRIGLEHLRELVVGIGIMDHFSGHDYPGDGLDPALLWEHALSVGACCSKLAQAGTEPSAELAFTAAILHDIGRLILIQTLPELYPKVLETAHGLGVPLELVEKRLLLVDHAGVSQNMLHAWNLPKDLVDAIANHHQPPSKLATLCPKNTRLCAVIALGNRIVHAMGIGCSGDRTIAPTEELFEILDSPGLTLEAIVDGLSDQIHEMQLLSPSDPSAGSSAQPSSDRGGSSSCPVFDRAFRPLYLTMNPEHDVIGHWVNRHADPGSDKNQQGTPEEPTIVIIHTRQPRDRQTLADRLVEAQRSLAGTNAPLPVLMLSPTGKNALPDEIMSRHPSVHLMTPFTQLHFERAVNHLLTGSVRPLEDWTKPKAA